MENSQVEFKKISFTAKRSPGEEETITLPINKIQTWRLAGDRGDLAEHWVFIGTRGKLEDSSKNGHPCVHLIGGSVSVSKEEYERLVKEKKSVDINHVVV